ncbi:hypothetical protein BDW59DRAFT_158402 [Aspergillus cavernicola]|uniref:Uncharacterized protein n=1 Tax=Aspergillus cavernicola TaxID=176166 RepID=A0ABR4ITA3_9EURO
MTQPAPRRALVDLDNIEFYRPQPAKSLPPESALSIPPILPPLSILPGAATRKALPRGDGALLFDRPYGWDSCCDPEVPNSFDVELARCANAASLATSSNTDSELTRGETSNETLDTSMFCTSRLFGDRYSVFGRLLTFTPAKVPSCLEKWSSSISYKVRKELESLK